MTDFSHLNKLKVSEKVTIDYELPEIGDGAVLKICSASQANKEYFNDFLRHNRKGGRVSSKKVSATDIIKMREIDKKLFAKHIVVDWSGVVDAQGNEVEFNKDDVFNLLNALPDWLFDDLRNFASDINNFLEDGLIDSEEVGKN